MSERPNPSEPLSPQDYQHQLRMLWSQLPDALNPMSDTASKQWHQRTNSEHKEAVLKKLGILLDHAHKTAQLTSSFRWFIEYQLENQYVSGVIKDEEGLKKRLLKSFPLHAKELEGPSDPLYHILDLDNPASEGIFNPNVVGELERRGYREMLSFELFIKESTEQIHGEGAYERLPRNKRIGSEPTRAERLQKWRDEFLARYNDEP